MRLAHVASPSGVPRCTLRRNAASSASVCGLACVNTTVRPEVLLAGVVVFPHAHLEDLPARIVIVPPHAFKQIARVQILKLDPPSTGARETHTLAVACGVRAHYALARENGRMDAENRNSPDDAERTVRFWVRVRGAIVGVGCVGVVVVAVFQLPDRVPMPPCSFKMNMGYPCPGCGMTHSMMAMARGEVIEAFHSHPFGVALFVFVAMCALLGLDIRGHNTIFFEKRGQATFWASGHLPAVSKTRCGEPAGPVVPFEVPMSGCCHSNTSAPLPAGEFSPKTPRCPQAHPHRR